MKINHILLISLLIVGLLIPAVSAETIEGQIHDVALQSEDIPANYGVVEFIDCSYWRLDYDPQMALKPSSIHLLDVAFYYDIPYTDYPNYQNYYLELYDGATKVADVQVEFFKGDYAPIEPKPNLYFTHGSVRFTFTNWNYEYLSTLTEKTSFRFVGLPSDTEDRKLLWMVGGAEVPSDSPVLFHAYYKQPASGVGHHVYYYETEYFTNNYTITINEYGTDISITRIFGDDVNPSKIIISKSDGTVLYESSDYETANRNYSLPYRDLIIDIESPYGKTYRILGDTTTPTDPDEPFPLRTGTVTMTDHNGTTISNFEVKAVNYYTGEEYTVSTDTDVATITLPMDRTIAFRNPQTGQYEDVPVGYYTFFVSKPGYKMTSEDGVRISVMPVEYSSYHLGDIIVTSEDGYLTGKHQFQIRSRADLSILQTGTISAQSATTGEWFNTTVTDGIATLILPYDTSNPYYEYVGNYYVYATSPGYIPSEYATQISVRPDTQSEIRYILLTPIGGIPEPGNVTLRIQAVSDSGQGIPNAQIHIDGLAGAGWEVWDTYTASSSGYLEVSVYENSTYDITVYGEGYYSSSQRIEVFTEDPPLLNIILYPTGAPTLTPTTQPTGWVTPPPTTQPPGGIPDEDDDSEGFLMEAIRGISKAFGVGFATGKTIFGMLLALAIGFATAKQLRGGAAEFGLGLLGGMMLGVLIGLLPIWTIVVLLLIVGMYIGYRYVGGSSNG